MIYFLFIVRNFKLRPLEHHLQPKKQKADSEQSGPFIFSSLSFQARRKKKEIGMNFTTWSKFFFRTMIYLVAGKVNIDNERSKIPPIQRYECFLQLLQDAKVGQGFKRFLITNIFLKLFQLPSMRRVTRPVLSFT